MALNMGQDNNPDININPRFYLWSLQSIGCILGVYTGTGADSESKAIRYN